MYFVAIYYSTMRRYLRRPAVVTIGTAGQAVDTVEQKVEMINEERKRDRLLQLLNGEYEPPIIIFVNQKKLSDNIAKALTKLGVSLSLRRDVITFDTIFESVCVIYSFGRCHFMVVKVKNKESTRCHNLRMARWRFWWRLTLPVVVLMYQTYLW
jgi:hypothetical protein